MGLSGLDTALSGLRVAQQQLSVISSNVSNVNTEGYTRKILPQQTVSVNGDSVGVTARPILRNVDLNLERDFWTQVSMVTALDVKAKYLDRIQEFHGPPNLEVSIAAELGKLRDTFSALADSPEDNFLQRTVVDQASLLSGKINKLAALITEMRNDVQDEVDVSVSSINTKLQTIAELNQQIKFNTASGKTTAELEDRRDQAIKLLSEEIDISFFTRGDGVLVVQTSSGVQLTDERPELLYYNRTPLGPGSYYPDPNNPIANGIFVGGSPARNPVTIDITQSNLNGKLGALLELRDDILPQQQAMLDELAHKMASRFEEQGLTLFTDKSGHVPADATAKLTGSVDLATLGLLDAATGPNNLFTIRLNAGGAAPAEVAFQIDLAVANTPAALVNAINNQIGLQPDAYGNTLASLDGSGQLNITSEYNITISANGAGEIGDAGLAVLGLKRGTEYAAPKTTPLTPVPYVGFANVIQVNQIVLDNNTLVQKGTAPTDLPVQSGSNEVVRRVIEFVFGETEFQEASNTDPATQIDLRSATSGGTSLQDWLGIYSQNSITSTIDLTGYSSVQAMIDAGGEVFQPPTGPVLDQFTLTFDDPRTGLPAQTYYLDLEDIEATFPIGGAIASAADQIAAAINNLNPANNPNPPSDAAAPAPAFDVQASVNAYGQLVIESRANITIDASFPTGNPPDGGMRTEGLAYLGLTAGSYTTTDPYIDVQVGNDLPTRVTIEPGDDETALMAKLQGVPGLAIDDDLVDALGGGRLILRPGDDPTNPTFGGDLKITGGPFASEGGASGTLAGTTIIAALFGTENPIRDIPHEIANAAGGYESFRRERLGPNAVISTGIISSTNLIDFAQKMINQQSAESISTQAQIKDETSFRDLLQRRLLDESAVNIEEELSQMIVVQTAFSAAARVISAIDEEFKELLNAIR